MNVSAGDDITVEELKKLDGTWQLLSAVTNGVATPPEVVKSIRVVIQGGRHTVHFGQEIVVKEVPFRIDLASDPKRMTDMLPDGQEIRGIYKLEGDTLTSCVAEVGKDHPTEFSSRPGTGQTLRVFRREK